MRCRYEKDGYCEYLEKPCVPCECDDLESPQYDADRLKELEYRLCHARSYLVETEQYLTELQRRTVPRGVSLPVVLFFPDAQSTDEAEKQLHDALQCYEGEGLGQIIWRSA